MARDDRYEIIGTRPTSAFRVHTDYFWDKGDRFAPGIDPTTGGPCAVVFARTDIPVPGATIDRRNGQVIIPIGTPDEPGEI